MLMELPLKTVSMLVSDAMDPSTAALSTTPLKSTDVETMSTSDVSTVSVEMDPLGTNGCGDVLSEEFSGTGSIPGWLSQNFLHEAILKLSAVDGLIGESTETWPLEAEELTKGKD